MACVLGRITHGTDLAVVATRSGTADKLPGRDPVRKYATRTMSTWNYRIIHDGHTFWVGEVYYDDNGAAVGYTSSSEDTLRWEERSELVAAINRIADDVSRHPVLHVDPKTEAILGDGDME